VAASIGGGFKTRAKELADDLVEWHALGGADPLAKAAEQENWRRLNPQRVDPEQRRRALEMMRAMDEKMHKDCKLPRTEPYSIGSGTMRVEVTGFYIR
jgi:hypothetical protein